MALPLEQPLPCAEFAALEAADRPRFQIDDLCVYLESYLCAEQIREVYRAYQFGAEAHAGQTRKSGGPYIQHPIAVARIIAEMRMDYICLMAALLHDVIEGLVDGFMALLASFSVPQGVEWPRREMGTMLARMVACRKAMGIQSPKSRRV